MPSNALAEPTLNASFFTNILYIKFGSKEIFIYEERQNVSFVTFSACFIIVWATFSFCSFLCCLRGHQIELNAKILQRKFKALFLAYLTAWSIRA